MSGDPLDLERGYVVLQPPPFCLLVFFEFSAAVSP